MNCTTFSVGTCSTFPVNQTDEEEFRSMWVRPTAWISDRTQLGLIEVLTSDARDSDWVSTGCANQKQSGTSQTWCSVSDEGLQKRHFERFDGSCRGSIPGTKRAIGIWI
jgi:hypothetical protein